MTPTTEQKLKNIIRQFCVSNPGLHTKTEEGYFKELAIVFSSISDYIVLEAIEVCEQKQLYKTKHINYFRGIVLSKENEIKRKKELEEKYLTPIPKIKLKSDYE